MGGQDGFFCDDFGSRIGTGNVDSVGKRFVGSREIAIVEYNAWGTGVDEFGYLKIAAAIDDGLSAFDVRFLKVCAFSPDTDFGGSVEDGVLILASGSDGRSIGEIDVPHLNAESFEFRLGATAKASYIAVLV